MELLAKWAATTLVAVACLALLTSCRIFMELPPDGPVAVAQAGQELKVVVCDPIVSTSFTMSEREPGGPWRVFWDNPGELRLDRDQVLSADTAEDLGVVRGEEPLLGSGNELLIQFVGKDESYRDTVNAGFSVPEGGIPAGMWLQTSGEVTEEACVS